MSAPLTVPPPREEDHEDVAWALRAASAQWRRDDVADAVGWVRRAAETAAEVGDLGRARELNQLATALETGKMTPEVAAAHFGPQYGGDEYGSQDESAEPYGESWSGAPPAPSFASPSGHAPPGHAPPGHAPPGHAPPLGHAPPPPVASRQPSLADVDVDLDVEEVELIDDDVIIEESEPSERFERGALPQPAYPSSYPSSMPAGAPAPPSARPAPRAKLPSFDDESQVSEGQIPPSPSLPGGVGAHDYPPRDTGLELDADEGEEDDRPSDEGPDIEFGEVDFQDEAPTNHRSAPPPPSVGQPTDERFSIDPSTPAEYAQSLRDGDHDHHDDIEQELGVDLSIGPSRYPEPESQHSPTPGRASVRPSRPPGATDMRSSGRQPYGLAPSASAPPVAPIEPPSKPSNAPPETTMAEPERHRSYPPPGDAAPAGAMPSVGPSPVPPSDPDDAAFAAAFDHMHSQGSRPPETEELQAAAADRAGHAPPKEAKAEPGRVDGIDLADVQGLQDLPEDAQARLAAKARVVTLGVGEEVSSFGVALVTQGLVQLMPTIADATCASARKGEVLFTRGTMGAADLRVVGAEANSRVAVFSDDELQAATADCPWVADELGEVADRYNAFAGAVMGPLGDSLDEMFRMMVFEKCTVRNLAPGTEVARAGEATDGMYIVGVGELEVLGGDGTPTASLHPGEFLFPETVLSASPAPQTVRAGSQGALVLYAPRMTAHELLATCPPFIEILAR